MTCADLISNIPLHEVVDSTDSAKIRVPNTNRHSLASIISLCGRSNKGLNPIRPGGGGGRAEMPR